MQHTRVLRRTLATTFIALISLNACASPVAVPTLTPILPTLAPATQASPPTPTLESLAKNTPPPSHTPRPSPTSLPTLAPSSTPTPGPTPTLTRHLQTLAANQTAVAAITGCESVDSDELYAQTEDFFNKNIALKGEVIAAFPELTMFLFKTATDDHLNPSQFQVNPLRWFACVREDKLAVIYGKVVAWHDETYLGKSYRIPHIKADYVDCWPK